jgi:hypothetical protein
MNQTDLPVAVLLDWFAIYSIDTEEYIIVQWFSTTGVMVFDCFFDFLFLYASSPNSLLPEIFPLFLFTIEPIMVIVRTWGRRMPW